MDQHEQEAIHVNQNRTTNSEFINVYDNLRSPCQVAIDANAQSIDCWNKTTNWNAWVRFDYFLHRLDDSAAQEKILDQFQTSNKFNCIYTRSNCPNWILYERRCQVNSRWGQYGRLGSEERYRILAIYLNNLHLLVIYNLDCLKPSHVLPGCQLVWSIEGSPWEKTVWDRQGKSYSRTRSLNQFLILIYTFLRILISNREIFVY